MCGSTFVYALIHHSRTCRLDMGAYTHTPPTTSPLRAPPPPHHIPPPHPRAPACSTSRSLSPALSPTTHAPLHRARAHVGGHRVSGGCGAQRRLAPLRSSKVQTSSACMTSWRTKTWSQFPTPCTCAAEACQQHQRRGVAIEMQRREGRRTQTCGSWGERLLEYR